MKEPSAFLNEDEQSFEKKKKKRCQWFLVVTSFCST